MTVPIEYEMKLLTKICASQVVECSSFMGKYGSYDPKIQLLISGEAV